MNNMSCRKGCGACCIAPSISSDIPGMPQGKPAGVRCVHLDAENLCSLYHKNERPKFCTTYLATEEFCGSSRDEALKLIAKLEVMTVTD